MENCRDFHKTALDRMARRRPNSTTRPNSLTAFHLPEFGSSVQNRCPYEYWTSVCYIDTWRRTRKAMCS
jgi:hypothetical protein